MRCLWIAYFNTSNVTIQRPFFFLIVFTVQISIHLMLLFNIIIINVFIIIISISIHLMLLFNRRSLRINYMIINFNTSNVTIQRLVYLLYQNCLAHFNTSNVTIQPKMLRYKRAPCYISIHLMLLFNQRF